MQQQPHPRVCIGIDWADQQHAVCLIDREQPDRPEDDDLPQQPGAIDAWTAELRSRFPGERIAICIEQSRGALIYALMKHESLVLYPVNPGQLASYRKALYPSGSKNDPNDAQLLALLWMHHHQQLRPWRPDNAQTRMLGILVEDRRKLVEQRVRLTNALKSRLKQYFPLALEMLTRLDSPLACEFLLRFGTLEQLRATSPEEITAFYRAYRCWHPELVEERLAKLAAAVPLTEDQAILAAGQLQVRVLATQLQAVLEGIVQYDLQIKEQFDRHPDAQLFSSLPGAGPGLAPRLLAAFGSDRERFATAEEVLQYTGIAPVTRRSGKQCHVSQRWACNKFLRQTFHEFAYHSSRRSAWAKAYYRMLRDRGKSHQAAVRSLAFKWIRILYRCWKSKITYNELAYCATLINKESPITKYLALPENQPTT